MAELTVFYTTPSGAPLISPANAPQIEIRRIDTGAIVQAFVAMTEIGQGKFSFAFTPTVSLDYTFVTDGDPTDSGQVSNAQRYKGASFPGTIDIVPLEDTVDQAEHDATQAAIAALNDIDQADVQAALTAQGYTSGRAPNLDNLDVAVSTRNSVTPLAAATDQAEHDATQAGIAANLAAIAALNDLSIADVQTALTNQGYTAARALLLDNLDAAITTRATQAQILSDATPFPGANIDAAISSRAVAGDAMTLTGATLTAIQALILSDATPFQGADIAAILTAVSALDSFIQGGREIDFTGDDAAGWQRVERDVGGTIIRRYDLFDETDTRINETVASFIGRQGFISRETISP